VQIQGQPPAPQRRHQSEEQRRITYGSVSAATNTAAPGHDVDPAADVAPAGSPGLGDQWPRRRRRKARDTDASPRGQSQGGVQHEHVSVTEERPHDVLGTLAVNEDSVARRIRMAKAMPQRAQPRRVRDVGAAASGK